MEGLNGVNLLNFPTFQTPIKNIHKTTINPTGFQHHGYLEKMMMVNLNSKKQSLQRLHDQAKTLIFYSFSQTHMRLFLSNKIQIHWTDLDCGFWGLLCFLSIILMYKREKLTNGSKDLGEFWFLFCFVFCYLFIYYFWWVFGQEDNRG